jgi:hypothetical protein
MKVKISPVITSAFKYVEYAPIWRIFTYFGCLFYRLAMDFVVNISVDLPPFSWAHLWLITQWMYFLDQQLGPLNITLFCHIYCLYFLLAFLFDQGPSCPPVSMRVACLLNKTVLYSWIWMLINFIACFSLKHPVYHNSRVDENSGILICDAV